MIAPLWLDPDAALPAPPYAGPLVLQIDPGSAAAMRIASQAGSSPDDLAAFAHRADAQARIQRRQIARVLIAKLAGIHPDLVRFGRSELGAPLIEAPTGWHVSFSGRGRCCLIGLARQPIGVDIEPEDADLPPSDALTASEQARLEDMPAREALIMWLAKEAHAKRIGQASAIEPQQIETERAADGVWAHSPRHRSHCWVRHAGGAVAAVALAAVAEVRPSPDRSRVGTTYSTDR